ncbi:MAG TPA: hypothetical protein VJA21_04730 [Verrucomicrobiae bacterium]
MKIHKYNRAGLLGAALGIASLAAGFAAVADEQRGVFPLHSKPYGKSYGEWAVAQIQWTMSIPIATSPWANDTTGEFAAIGQSGPVWFLGSSLGGSLTRTFTMPAGKAIFVPVNLWVFGAVAFDCEPSVPGVVCDVPTLYAAAAEAADAAVVLAVSVDGRPIRNLRNYRAVSPGPFGVTVPADNISGVPAGTHFPQVADGYFVILEPLSVGRHTIWVNVVNANGFETTLAYNITVAPPREREESED